MFTLTIVAAALLPATLLASPFDQQEQYDSPTSLAKRDYWGDAQYFGHHRYNYAMRRNARYAARAYRHGWNIAPPYGYFNKRSIDDVEETSSLEKDDPRPKTSLSDSKSFLDEKKLETSSQSKKSAKSDITADDFFGKPKADDAFDFGPVDSEAS
jgi:hypothetical protein